MFAGFQEEEMMANMVMTTMEAHVSEDRWAALVEGFARLDAERPPQMAQGYLVQSSADPTLWRSVGLWYSHSAFQEYHATGVTPGAMLLFRSVGAEPTLGLFEVKSQVSA